jgi:hypothetical protein
MFQYWTGLRAGPFFVANGEEMQGRLRHEPTIVPPFGCRIWPLI